MPSHLYDWTLVSLGTACSIYIVQQLPSFIFPQGIISLFISFLVGCLATLGLLLVALYKISTPLETNIPHTHTSSSAAHQTEDTEPTLERISRSPQLDQHPSLPHPLTRNGHYSGIIYTAPLSTWSRDRCLFEWPPHAHHFKSWNATIDSGTLVLRSHHIDSIAHHHHHHRRPRGKRDHRAVSRRDTDADASTTTTIDSISHDENQQLDVIGIPLEGCVVELVKDCLQGRSEMVRRAPLLIMHPTWTLMDNERGLWLFADDAASKQQWWHALLYWCGNIDLCTSDSNSGGSSAKDAVSMGHDGAAARSYRQQYQQMSATYDEYCKVMSRQTILPYLRQVRMAVRNGQAGQDPIAAGNVPCQNGFVAGFDRRKKKKGWQSKKNLDFDTNSNNNNNQKKNNNGEGHQFQGNNNDEAAADDDMPHFHTPRNNLLHENSAATDTTSPSPVPSVLNNSNENNNHNPIQQGGPAASPGRHPPIDIDSIIEQRWMQSRKIPVPSPPPKKKESSSATSSAVPSAATSPVKVSSARGSVDAEHIIGVERREQMVAVTSLSSSHDTVHHNPTSLQQQQQQRSQSTQPSPFPPPLSSNSPLLLPPDHFINMAITRICFDLLRNPSFSTLIQSRIQQNISRLRLPKYISSLGVISIDPGCTSPTASHFRALPLPEEGGNIWPQLVFDMSYKGSFTVVLECKVNVRDAPAWSRVYSIIQMIEGTTGGDVLSKGKECLGEELNERQNGQCTTAAPSSADESEDDNGEESLLGDNTGDDDDDGGTESGSMSAVSLNDNDSVPHAAIEKIPLDCSNQTQCHQVTPRQGGGKLFDSLRQRTAEGLRQFAESTAARIANISIRVSLTFSVLEGTMVAWIAPPPGDRLFWSFLSPPKLSMKALPIVAGRHIKQPYAAAKVSNWIQERIELSFRKNMVYPSGGDIPLPFLMSIEDERVFHGLPGLREILMAHMDNNKKFKGNGSPMKR